MNTFDLGNYTKILWESFHNSEITIITVLKYFYLVLKCVIHNTSGPSQGLKSGGEGACSSCVNGTTLENQHRKREPKCVHGIFPKVYWFYNCES